jgi:hypothetical protein
MTAEWNIGDLIVFAPARITGLWDKIEQATERGKAGV